MYDYQEFTVSELSCYIRKTLEDSVGHVRVTGEIVDFKVHSQTGNVYFSITDKDSTLRVIVFHNTVEQEGDKFPKNMQNGEKISVYGKITTYKKGSYYQIIASHLERCGLGDLIKLLEETKQRLLLEGIFDESRKIPIPFLPQKIGVITSATGAVIQDITITLKGRFPSHIILYPALTQGNEASRSVMGGVKYFNSQKKDSQHFVDVIIIARGGGSFEDLFCFNDETLIRAVSKSKIPIVSAIGHETDYTLLDFVADVRAPTPTAAARMVVPDISELKYKIYLMKNSLTSEVKKLLISFESFAKSYQHEFCAIGKNHVRHLSDVTQKNWYYIAQKSENILQRKQGDLNRSITMFSALSICIVRIMREVKSRFYVTEKFYYRKMCVMIERVNCMSDLFTSAIKSCVNRLHDKVGWYDVLLNEINSTNVIKKGYAIVRDKKSRRIIKDSKTISASKSLVIQMKDGDVVIENTNQGGLF